MSAVTEHCDAQCHKCPIGCVSPAAAAAMDEAAEWSARAHPMPHPQPAPSREPIPTQPFAPGVIERHTRTEHRKATRLLLAILGASACLVMWGAWRWMR